MTDDLYEHCSECGSVLCPTLQNGGMCLTFGRKRKEVEKPQVDKMIHAPMQKKAVAR